MRVYHTGRRQYGTIAADMPSAPDTVFVVFDGDPDPWEVSRARLDEVADEEQACGVSYDHKLRDLGGGGYECKECGAEVFDGPKAAS